MPDPDLYRERAYLVAHLAAVYPSHIGTDPAEPDWPVVYVEAGAGQLSWHISAADLPLFAHVPRGEAGWDGHTTAQKYGRLDNLTRTLAARGAAA